MKKIVFFMMCMFISSLNISSLATTEFTNIPSPNAADLGKYGDIPMSLYTGRANVNIPLYSTEQNGVPLDISLSYDTGGLLVNNLPGWTGHGWTLNAGGCITRIMNFQCDEVHLPIANNEGYKNYFDNHDKLLSYVGSINESNYWDNKVKISEMDLQPDVFIFNFMGKTGRFFLGNDGKWKVLCDENINVVFDISDTTNYSSPCIERPNNNKPYPKVISSITLKDDKGITYIFGNSPNAIEYSTNLFYFDENYWASSCWYLTEVKDRFGNTLYRFTYQRGKFSVQLSESYTSESGGVNTGSYEGSYSEAKLECISGTLTLPSYLSSITTLGKDSIHFNSETISQEGNIGLYFYSSIYKSETDGNNTCYSKLIGCRYEQNNSSSDIQTISNYFPFLILENYKDYQHMPDCNNLKKEDPLISMELRKLTSIQVYKENNLLKSYVFKYNIGDDLARNMNTGDNELGRLFLKKVTLKGSDENIIGLYKMTYNKKGYEKKFDDCLTDATDYWGYYNGADNNGGYGNMPTYKIPNEEKCKIGMLSQLEYPTGGYSKFDYQLNIASSYYTKDKNIYFDSIGGLRVTSIENHDSNGSLLQRRKFSYEGGELHAKPINTYTDTIYYGDTKSVISIEKSSTINQLFNSFGTHIGYSKVKETQYDSCYTIYEYTNSDLGKSYQDEPFIQPSGNIKDPETIFDKNSDRSFMRGKLRSVKKYDSNDTLFHKTEYTYVLEEDSDQLNYFVYTNNISPYLCNTYGIIGYTGKIYKLYFPKNDLCRKVETSYFNGKAVVDTTIYKMADLYFDGNFRILLTPTDTIGFDSYKEYEESVKDARFRYCASEEKIRAGEHVKINYTYPSKSNQLFYFFANTHYFPLLQKDFLHNGEQYYSEGTAYQTEKNSINYIQPFYDWKKFGSGDKYIVSIYKAFDENHRLTKYINKDGSGGQASTRLFWDDCNRLSAKVTYSALDSIKFSAHDGILKTLTFDDGSSIFEEPVTDAFIYKYNKYGLLSSITSGNGYTEYYYYDSFGRLQYICDADNNALKKFSYNYSLKK